MDQNLSHDVKNTLLIHVHRILPMSISTFSISTYPDTFFSSDCWFILRWCTNLCMYVLDEFAKLQNWCGNLKKKNWLFVKCVKWWDFELFWNLVLFFFTFIFDLVGEPYGSVYRNSQTLKKKKCLIHWKLFLHWWLGASVHPHVKFTSLSLLQGFPI